MPLLEVDDEVARALAANGVRFTDASGRVQKLSEVEANFNKLLSGPKRREILMAYKEQFPNAVIPEIDAAVPVNAAVEALTKQFDDYKASVQKEKDDAAAAAREAESKDTVSKGRSWLRRDQKLDDEGVAAVEKLMVELGIPNYEVAFNHFRAQNPAQATDIPPSYAGRSLDWFSAQENAPDHTLLLKDPEAFKRKEIAKIFREKAEGRLVA